MHRDFKPSNVMLGLDGRARVMDFGLVRLGEEAGLGSSHNTARIIDDDDALSTALTQHGSVLGTPFYMPPEQLAGVSNNPKSDRYAFCVAVFVTLYGQYPFPPALGSEYVGLEDPDEARRDFELALELARQHPGDVPGEALRDLEQQLAEL